MKNKEIIKEPSNCRELPVEEERLCVCVGIKDNNMERDDDDDDYVTCATPP